MTVDEFTQNLKLRILHDMRMRVKQDIGSEIQNLNCKSCDLQKYSVEKFTDNDNSIVAHLKCSNCGFETNVTVNLDQSEFEKGITEVNQSLHDFQNTIENLDRKLKK
jgi:RNase P subunit RPR2